MVKSEFRVPIGSVLGKDAVANVSQLRYLDSKRLLKKITEMEYAPFIELKKKTDEVNFHQPFPIDPPSVLPESGEPNGHNLM